MSDNPVTKVAKQLRDAEDDIVVLADGRRGKVTPVPAMLVAEVMNGVKDPPVPMFHDEEKGRDIPNPSDPEYLKALETASNERGLAGSAAMLMFGLELLDGVPQDGLWLLKLKNLSKRGYIDLSAYDLNDEIDVEFLYKRYVAADSDVIQEIGKRAGLTASAIKEAEDTFPGTA